MVLDDVPNDRVGNPMVLMPQHVPDTHDLRPGDVRPGRLNLRRNAAGRLGDDLDATLNAVAEKPIGAVMVEGLSPRGGFDPVDRFEDRSKRGTKQPLGQKIRSAEPSMRSRSSGSR